MLGFKTMKTAYATIKGYEVMRAIKKGQIKLFTSGKNDIMTNKNFIEAAMYDA